MMRLSNEMSTLVFIYNSFNDPLFQNLVLTYIKTLAKKGNYVFYVITFEQDNYRITEKRHGDPQSLFAKSNLATELLDWTPQYSNLDTIIQSMWKLYSKESQNAVH